MLIGSIYIFQIFLHQKAQSNKSTEVFFFNSTQQLDLFLKLSFCLVYKHTYTYLIHYKWLLNIPYHVALYYSTNVSEIKHALFFLFFITGDRHIFPQKTHMVGKIEIDTGILCKLWIYK